MDVREKLIDILRNPIFPNELVDKTEAVADYLLDSGVTVQDGKPLEAFLHPVDAYKGLKAKYFVFKADTGERVGNCFVLRPDKDHAAVEAIRAYASATDNETLSEDIYNWVGKGEPVQEWISVEEPPKEYRDEYGELIPFLVCAEGTDYPFRAMYDGKTWGDGIFAIHVKWWMPLPQPPKGE